MSNKILMTLPQVAELLNVSRSQVRSLIKKAGLPYIQLVKRGTILFHPDRVEAWVKKHERKV